MYLLKKITHILITRVLFVFLSFFTMGLFVQAMKLPEPMIKTEECDAHHDMFISAVNNNQVTMVCLMLEDPGVVKELSSFDKLYTFGRAIKNKNQDIACKMLGTHGFMSNRTEEMCNVMSWAFEEAVRNNLDLVVCQMIRNVEFRGGVSKESKQRVKGFLAKRKEQCENN